MNTLQAVQAASDSKLLFVLATVREQDTKEAKTTYRRIRRELNRRKPVLTVKCSETTKMPKGCFSWSLQAVTHCPGSRLSNGELVPACEGCYARTGHYHGPDVIAIRMFNAEDWKRSAWVEEMVYAIRGDAFFRWFDSGDVYNIRLAKKILKIMKSTPYVKHWLPTRMYKFDKFLPVFDAMAALPNVVVRFSSDAIDGSILKGANTSTIVPTHDSNAWPNCADNVTVCDAYERNGKCADCRECWSKGVQVIAYVAHGHRMQKLIKIEG